MDVAIFLTVLVVAAVFGLITAAIAKRKGHNPVGYGILGFLLPMIGLIVVVVLPNKSR